MKAPDVRTYRTKYATPIAESELRDKLQALVAWLENECEKRIGEAMSRRDYAKSMREGTVEDLQAAKKLAEQMAGRKLPSVDATKSGAEKSARIDESIAMKIEAQGLMLSVWADTIRIVLNSPIQTVAKPVADVFELRKAAEMIIRCHLDEDSRCAMCEKQIDEDDEETPDVAKHGDGCPIPPLFAALAKHRQGAESPRPVAPDELRAKIDAMACGFCRQGMRLLTDAEMESKDVNFTRGGRYHCHEYTGQLPFPCTALGAEILAIPELREAIERAGKPNAKDRICAEIQSIMETYREQAASRSGVDTPGGLEHMGDVWSLLRKWDTWLEPDPTALEPSHPARPAAEKGENER